MVDSQREGMSIPKNLKILAALHFYAQNSFQKIVGQDFLTAMSQASVSRCLHEVTNVINEHLTYLIQFPVTPEHRAIEKGMYVKIKCN